ncbi:MAG TPA: hypothetical protein VMT85_04110 [Thermoanaerobaculia bacterium]|nr:hypothetical protein [Thermoanaerobaculia bacterium]
MPDPQGEAEVDHDPDRTNGDGGAGRDPAVVDTIDRQLLGSALRACQVASEACSRAIPLLSSLEDGRVHALSDGLELSELCAQALGRALEGSASPFLEDELSLCSKVAMACVEAVEGDASFERCALACLSCAQWCERVSDAKREARERSAA